MEADKWWMMKAFRVMAVKNYVEPESYNKIVSSNVQNVVGKMGGMMESFHINIKLGQIQYEDNIYQIVPI